jgi:hypothetical protein
MRTQPRATNVRHLGGDPPSHCGSFAEKTTTGKKREAMTAGRRSRAVVRQRVVGRGRARDRERERERRRGAGRPLALLCVRVFCQVRHILFKQTRLRAGGGGRRLRTGGGGRRGTAGCQVVVVVLGGGAWACVPAAYCFCAVLVCQGGLFSGAPALFRFPCWGWEKRGKKRVVRVCVFEGATLAGWAAAQSAKGFQSSSESN